MKRPLDTLSGTYCNPLPLPDYPRGMLSHDKTRSWGWLRRERMDFRETADPSVIYHEGKWYLYPSCGMAFVSEDFVTWTHHRVEPYKPGYAPTVVVHPDGHCDINSGGHPGQATAGSGDVLTGAIAGFLAQGCGTALSSTLGVYLHSRASEIAAAGFG